MPLSVGITSLAPLNTDIQAAIFDHLSATTHKPTIRTLLLLSRKHYSKFRCKLYRDVTLNSTNVERFLGPLLVGGDQSGASELQTSEAKVAYSIIKYVGREQFGHGGLWGQPLDEVCIHDINDINQLRIPCAYNRIHLYCQPGPDSVILDREVAKFVKYYTGEVLLDRRIDHYEPFRPRIAYIYSPSLSEISPWSYNRPVARLDTEKRVLEDVRVKSEDDLENEDEPTVVHIIGQDDLMWDLPCEVCGRPKF
ncbi:hypothetical protein L202_07273 [Cryptococcus amylolentus CBS 6039]|uniref:Uncharacterized protein n=1 Tax=Cryptococcus amylolentus CBS 6039 TaxID=1295533 RepID=A0A1E3HBM8_9TREE|nr:hypothetical protein L202_07273 [Cryptococcus amylolentus CBS 6039]ODN73733.1 hypothetical protein L202_07273 [Cryptococcus amylolentus CBS 6039]